MKSSGTCPKCGSRNVEADATVLDRTDSGFGELSVATYRKPQARVFKGEVSTPLSAWVCIDCGFVEFYADSPGSIKTKAT
jgi:predicted nucleic-acid-binding Zn-ribbon protein